MADQIQIMSVNGYMQKYAIDGISKGADRWQVKRDMLDEFRREIFNTAVFRVGPQVFSNEWEGTDKDRQKLESIIDNANKKWRSLCREFEKYKETSGLLKETDLQDYLEERLDLATGDMDGDGISTARMATEDEVKALIGEEVKAVEDLREDIIHEEKTEEEAIDGSEQAD